MAEKKDDSNKGKKNPPDTPSHGSAHSGFSQPSSSGDDSFSKSASTNDPIDSEKIVKKEEELAEKVEEEITELKEEKKEQKVSEKKQAAPPKEHHKKESPQPQGAYAPDTTSEEAEQRARERQEEQAERKAQYEEQKAQLEEHKAEAIAKVKDWRDKKIEYIKDGPHGFVKKATSHGAFITSALIDSGIAFWPVAGDLIGFAFNLTFWFVPFMLGGAFKSYFKIIIFYFIDLIIGLIGTLANAIFPVGGDMIVDALPEAFMLLVMRKHSPPDILLESYTNTIPDKIRAVDKKAKKKIEAIQKATSIKEKSLRKILQGKRPLTMGISLDGQKMITLLFSIAILMMGPMAVFLPFRLPRISLEPSSLMITGIIVVLMFVFAGFKFITKKQATGLFIFLALNLVMTFLFQNTPFISKYLGNSTVIAMILLAVGGMLYVAALEGWMSTKQIGVVVVLILLALVTPYMISYIGSAKFDADIERGQIQAEGEIKQANFWEQMQEWFTLQKKRGSGEIIGTGENEQTSEFIGVAIEDVSTYKEYYHLGEPVVVDIAYSANSYQDLTILTLCDIQEQDIQGDVEPKFAYASETKSPRVRCEFNDLPKGYYNVDVTAYYQYLSSTKIPIAFMEEEYANRLLYESKTANGPTPAEKVDAASDKVITDSGPIYIAASTAVEDGVSILKNPIIVSREDPNRYMALLKVQFPSFTDAVANAGIDEIHRASFSLPQGLHLYDCSFARNQILDHTVDQETGRWLVEVVDEFNEYDSYETLACSLQIDPQYVEEFIPSAPGVEPWERHTIGFEVDYNYKLYEPGVVPISVT